MVEFQLRGLSPPVFSAAAIESEDNIFLQQAHGKVSQDNNTLGGKSTGCSSENVETHTVREHELCLRQAIQTKGLRSHVVMSLRWWMRLG